MARLTPSLEHSPESADAVSFEYFFFWSAHTQTIRFYARQDDKRIRCAVTRTALADFVGSPTPLKPLELERVFEQHRKEIERVAAAKILHGYFQSDGTVLIRTVDLNR